MRNNGKYQISTQGPKAKFGKLLWYSQPKGSRYLTQFHQRRLHLHSYYLNCTEGSVFKANKVRLFSRLVTVYGWNNTNCRISSKHESSWTIVITMVSISGHAWFSKEVWVNTVSLKEQHLIKITLKLMQVLLLNSVEAEMNSLTWNSST